MRIIDEKGRLFGRINIIDFLAALFLVGLLPMFYFGHKIFTAKPKIVAIEYSSYDIVMLCKLIKVEPNTVKLISVGDKEYAPEGVIGEIISVEEVAPYSVELNTGAGESVIKEDQNYKTVVARIKLRVSLKNSEIYYKDKKFYIGSPLDFKTDKYSATIIPISESEYFTEKDLDLYIVLKDVDSNLLPLIGLGDKEIEPSGKAIAEILSIGKVENNSFTFNLGSNTFLRAEDALRKQVTVKMRLRCQIGQNDQVYFKGKKIGYSLPIEFNTEKYRIKGIVTQTFEMPLRASKETWVSIQVKFTGVIPEVSNLIKEGDSAANIAGDISGKLTRIISNKQSEILSMQGAELITVKHPFYKDVLVWLDILCLEVNGNYYFNNLLIKIGNTFNFTTNLYNISGTITGLQIR